MAQQFKPADADEMAQRGLGTDGTSLKPKKPVKQAKPVAAAAPDTTEAQDGAKN